MPPRLALVIAESALERVPAEIQNHPEIIRYAKRRGKKPGEVLLDRSYHHSAMMRLKNAERRGRPDIVHFSLLEALGSPLNKGGLLDLYVHTFDDCILSVDRVVRLPKNYNRFVGLMEDLLELGRVPPEGEVLITAKRGSLKSLISELHPTTVLVLTSGGRLARLDGVMEEASKAPRLAVIIGGFPRGEFSEDILKLADRLVAISPEPLEAWTVVSRVIYEYERAVGLSETKLETHSQ